MTAELLPLIEELRTAVFKGDYNEGFLATRLTKIKLKAEEKNEQIRSLEGHVARLEIELHEKKVQVAGVNALFRETSSSAPEGSTA